MILKAGPDTWQQVPTPGIPAGSAVLTDVIFARDADGWATGYLVRDGSSQHQPLVLHWDGTAWATTVIPWAEGASAVPRSIAVADDGAVWIAGTQLLPEVGDAQAFVAHAAAGPEGAWTIHDRLPINEGRSELFSIVASADGALVSGVAPDQAFLLQTCTDSTADQEGQGADADEAGEDAAGPPNASAAAGGIVARQDRTRGTRHGTPVAAAGRRASAAPAGPAQGLPHPRCRQESRAGCQDAHARGARRRPRCQRLRRRLRVVARRPAAPADGWAGRLQPRS